MNRLDERLNMLYELVPRCRCVADIGTDHGFLPLALLESGKCSKAIACDISLPSLQKAAAHSRETGISLDCRQGDGLAALDKDEADCIVIAGMGGVLIAELLERGRDQLGNALLVLQPMTAVKELREYLCANGFLIVTEEIVFQEERLYHGLTARLGEAEPDYDCEIGGKLKEHPLYQRYLDFRRNKELEIIRQMGAYRGEEYDRHLALIKKIEREARHDGNGQ